MLTTLFTIISLVAHPVPPPKIDPTELEIAIEMTTTPREPIECNCVTYARQFVDFPPPFSELKPNSRPQKGGAVLLDYNGVKHIAYILEIYNGGVYVTEANFEKCQITERLIEWDDPHITGFYF